MEAALTGGSPLVKAKGYLKALQRSFSSSALERSFSLDEEDPGVMTIDFLRSRLQAQRARSRAEKQRADMLARKVWELEQKLRARDLPRYELEGKARNHDERLVDMMMADDVENQKSCKCVACDNSNSPYPIPRSPNDGKKIRIPPSFSSYAYHRRSYVDNETEASYSPRQGQQMGMLSHQAFHDPQILQMLQDGGSVQEKALQGSIWDRAQELPSVKLEPEDGYGGFSQCHLGMNKLSIVARDQLRPSTKLHHTSKQFHSCPNIAVEYAKNVIPETFYANANDTKPHAAPKKGGRGNLERQSGRRQLCPHCSAVSTLVTTNISSSNAASQHPQLKTALNRCVSYDTLSLSTNEECLRAFDFSKEHNHQRSSKGLCAPAYRDRHDTRLKLLQEDLSPISTSL